jgi:hypothetical protein
MVGPIFASPWINSRAGKRLPVFLFAGLDYSTDMT